jgi:DNA-binding beta-propeller fold protein YncE
MMFKKYAVFILLLSVSAPCAWSQAPVPLLLNRTITLPGVTGKFDHFALDTKGKRLFAAASGVQSVLIIDLDTGKVADTLKGFGKPHGLAWIPGTGRLFVADGGKATLDVFEGSPLKLIKTIPLSEDADDMVYDPATGLLYVGHGGTNAANPSRVAIVDAHSLTLVANIPVASHPEALELDTKGDRIFANIADDGQIAVIDGKTHSLLATWTLKGVKGNTPLAYDDADDLLLVGCRTPARFLVLNAKTGEQIANVPASAGADDLFYEPATHRAYLIAGSGSIDSFNVSSDGKLRILPATHTSTGAKTGLLAPGDSNLYIGIPGTDAPAAVRVYRSQAK